MSLADRRDLSRARLELAVHRQLTNLWAKAVEAASNADQGATADADGLVSYQRHHDTAIAVAARAILARADVLCEHVADAAYAKRIGESL